MFTVFTRLFEALYRVVSGTNGATRCDMWLRATMTVLALAVAPRSDNPATCVLAWGAARYSGVGYNHVVQIHNNCTLAAVCTVTTNVNPSPMSVEVPPSQTVEVVTWMGSPSRVFEPRVACSLTLPSSSAREAACAVSGAQSLYFRMSR